LLKKEKDKVAQSLIQVFSTYSHKAASSIISSTAIKEPIISDSMSIKLFSSYCQIVFQLNEYLKNLLYPLLDELCEYKEEVKGNSDALMECTQKMVNGIAKSFSTLPSPIVDICTTLKGQISNLRSAVDKVLQLLLLGLYAPALENLEQFNLSHEGAKKKLKKTLQLMADVFTSIGSNSEEKDPRMSLFISKQYDALYQAVINWLSSTAVGVEVPLLLVPWSATEEKLAIVAMFLSDKVQQISSKLGNGGSTKIVAFKLAELVDNLVAANQRLETTKSSMF